MQVSYALSAPLVSVETAQTSLDLLLNFQGADPAANAPGDTTANPSAQRRPLNLSLVIDRSGSMAGNPLRNAVAAAQALVDRLTPNDYLSVVTYDDAVETIVPHQPVSDPSQVKALLASIRAGGCTNLSGGWLKGCDYVRAHQSPDRLNRVLLLTDGQANMGVTNPQILINTAREQAEQGVVTTTLGFGQGFNEDLLMGMAQAAEGNFYFIQSPDDAAQVFRIELDSLMAVAAQNLTVTVEPGPGVTIAHLLNSYRSQPGSGPSSPAQSQLTQSQLTQGQSLVINLGDVYSTEAKPLALALTANLSDPGLHTLANLTYEYQAIVNDRIQSHRETLAIEVTVGDEGAVPPADRATLEQISRLRVARAKDEAIALADQGQASEAAAKLRATIADLQHQGLDDAFEIAEEIEQLEHYAQQIERNRFHADTRKELRDQAYQGQRRDREDLLQRGSTSGGEAHTLPTATEAGEAIQLRCLREGGKLRVRVISEGYDSSLNVQFPRNIRHEGVTYLADEVVLTSGGFYRVNGPIRRLVQPGADPLAYSNNAVSHRSHKPLSNTLTAADLESVDSVGNGILIQCVPEGKKLRARVVSDGYNPDFKIRFPRSIREMGVLYVVDAVEEAKAGGSYVAYGKVRRLVQ